MNLDGLDERRWCQCLRCRYPLFRRLYYVGKRWERRWHWLVTCRIKGHRMPSPVSWKTYCLRCERGS